MNAGGAWAKVADRVGLGWTCGVCPALAFAALVPAGCQQDIDGADSSFAPAPMITTATTGDPANAGTGSDTDDPPANPDAAVACKDYLACLTELSSDRLGAMTAKFGPDGRCFEVESTETCDGQCDAAMDALLAAVDPSGLPVECGGSGFEPVPENTDAACMDGTDNDGNGFIDCDDPGCTTTLGVTACLSSDEDSNASCADGIDNDGDDFIDCDDFDCSMNPDVTVCIVPEDSDEPCSDGFDNDGDGFVDCDDFDCSKNPSVSVCVVPEDDNSRCDDGVDNDGDGFLDCEDFDCSQNPSVTICG